MAEYIRLQNSFTTGYLDPILHGLTNTEAYASGLQECVNMIPSSTGYVYRRPGTKYIGHNFKKSDGSKKTVRLCTVRAGETPVLVLISAGRIDFFREGDPDGIYTVAIENGKNSDSVPWLEKDLYELDIFEYESRLFIVHKDYKPHVIKAIYGISTRKSFQYADYESTVVAEGTIAVRDLTCISSYMCREVEFDNSMFSTPGNYPSCQTFKGGRWYLSGCEDDPISIYASRTPDAQGNERITDFTLGRYYLMYTQAKITKTYVYKTNESAQTLDSVTYDSESSSDKQIDEVLVNADQLTNIDVPKDTSTDVVTRKDADGNTTDNPSNTKTKIVETSSKTYTLKTDIQPSDGIKLTESDMFGSRVLWLLTQQRLLTGTERSIWMDTGAGATPADFDIVQTLAMTVAPVHPVQWGSIVIYVPGDRRSVKGFFYDDNSGGYRNVDLSATARSLFTANVVSLAVCEGQETILWVLLANGTMLSCTLGNTYGWATHSFGGNGFVTDMAPYYDGKGGSWVYLAVDRTTADSKHIVTIERLELEDLVQTDNFSLMDCQIDVTSLDTNGKLPKATVDELFGGAYSEELGGYAVFNGWPYAITKDGSNYVFSDGIDSLETWAGKKVQLGYTFSSKLKMLWQELPVNSGQTSLGMKRRTSSMVLQLYRSGDLECGYQTGKTERLERIHTLVKGNQLLSKDPELYTGLVKVSVASGTDEMVHAVVQADKPLPMTILALETKYSLQEV